ncbi:enoyl-CoA hydratase/isomerase family protein [Microbacterium sp.]|uniref:enoyl-CoA hydratase/isomerase family protein n=1 Tax=Microbacterium sp. TaxID=51671 RepID=UPI0037C89FBB
MTAQPDVLVERHDSTMLLTLNRPARNNAISGTMLQELVEAFDEAAQDDSVHVVVTAAAGPSFCVGADIDDFDSMKSLTAREILSGSELGGQKGLRELTADERALDDLGNAGRWLERMWRLEKPTIAAVGGAAVGGGFGIALLHDLIVASSSARLGAGFSKLGLAPEFGISLLLPRIVGLSNATELLYTARLIEAEEARSLGLVSQVVPDDELLDSALALADRIGSMPPVALRATKRLLRASMTRRMPEQLRAEHATHLVLFDHPETHAALDRMVAKLTGRR